MLVLTPWVAGREVACCLAAPLLGWVLQPAGGRGGLGGEEELLADWPRPAILML